jgi:hypothetical protein
MKMSTRLVACAVTVALASGSLLGCTQPQAAPPAADAAGAAAASEVGTLAIGPEPTEAMLNASRGPHAITSQRGNGSGFASGTVSYPTDQSLGKLGAIVIVPGFLSAESSISWWGPRIASWGFVAMTIGTNTVTDFPPSRASQQQAALRWLTSTSPVASRIDGTRLAAGGWSMGGGGSLDAARSNANIKVVLPMAPWNPGSRYAYNKPTFILSCSSDAIAGNGSNSNVFYSSLTGEKAQLTISGSHFCPTTPNAAAGRLAVSWLKRFLDGDTRFSSFICDSSPGGVSYRNTCPV